MAFRPKKGKLKIMIHGLSHLTFIVKNLDKMENLLVCIFGAEKIYDSGDETFSLSSERFFLIGGLWIAIMEGDALSKKTYNHVAFKIDDGDFDNYLARIHSLNLEILDGRSRVDGEGRSIYFYDYDNHLFELHSGTLHKRLKRYEKGL